MATFTVATFGKTGGMDLGGQGFTPNVPGPDGTGNPGTATSVYLTDVTIGYPSSDTTGRLASCLIYSIELDDPDDIGSSDGLLGRSDSHSDGSAFGASSFTRNWNFDPAISALDPTATYYMYFKDGDTTDQYLCYKKPNPYTGGVAQDADLNEVPYSLQFQVTLETDD